MQVVGVLAPLFGFLLVAGGVGYGGFILLQALRTRIDGTAGAPMRELEDLRERLVDLEERVAHGSDLKGDPRIAELEERVDFTERLLASEHERAVLPEATGETPAPNRQGDM